MTSSDESSFSSSASSPPRLTRRGAPLRRLSSPMELARPTLRPRSSSCTVLPPSLEALDLSSPTPSLASLRLHVLSHLADLEEYLSSLQSPSSLAQALLDKGEMTVDEARAWLNDALDMLERIRADVNSYLPELSFDSLDSYSTNLKSRLPDVPSLEDVRTHLPDIPHLELPDFDFNLSDMRVRLDDLSVRLSSLNLDLDTYHPLQYVPTLYAHLDRLHTHLSSEMNIQMPSSFARASMNMTATFSQFVDKMLASQPLAQLTLDDREDDNALEKAAKDLARAIKRSVNGASLITYADLPHAWRNNHFVSSGYRFIPLERWPLIFLSLFALHNETLNIHTHLVPFVFSALSSSRILPFTLFFQSHDEAFPPDLPERAFTAFAQVCLFCSVLWHTMAGCAHLQGMELCARIDYVGIGWLISASIGTIVYYGFACYPNAITVYLVVELLSGIAGSVLPFMAWFNARENKNWRIAFFLTLALTAVAPLAHLALLYSPTHMLSFIRPIVPSLVSYIVGLLFYATHFPECYLSTHPNSKLARYLDFLGGGSHAIWHAFIVLAISQHKNGMRDMRGGIAGGVCDGMLS